MIYEKIIYFSDNTPNQPSKFRTKNCVKINDNLHVTYTSMLKSSLCLYSNAYILPKEAITITIRASRR